ncbi:MAG: hypothetical protein CM1200mP18_22750 [Gammaproteobacteria bacterium]|nr:MAG: hypothetical protein CM1200mP18_22750 [Gammaproteobacteria bacterium]
MTKPIPKSMTDGMNDLLGFQLVEWRSGYAVLEVELMIGIRIARVVYMGASPPQRSTL